MRRALLALPALGLVLLALAGNALLLSPRTEERARLEEQVDAARQEEEALRAGLADLRRLAADGTTQEAEGARFGRLIPDTPDLAGFIRTMNDLAARAQVDWSSLTPSAPVPGAGGRPTTISLSINVGGTFFQILDYLRQLEDLDRLVVVDALDVASASGAGSGSPTLSVNLRGRTFAAPAAPSPAGGA